MQQTVDQRIETKGHCSHVFQPNPKIGLGFPKKGRQFQEEVQGKGNGENRAPQKQGTADLAEQNISF